MPDNIVVPFIFSIGGKCSLYRHSGANASSNLTLLYIAYFIDNERIKIKQDEGRTHNVGKTDIFSARGCVDSVDFWPIRDSHNFMSLVFN